ncbi:ABC transporter substrate-binding protein, partial [Chelativorans composti]
MRSARLFALALMGATALAGLAAGPAAAQTVLRLDEVAVGELDPAKATDYADSILMFNVYDTLVLPKQGEPGYAPHLAEGWEADGNDFVFTLRKDVKFQSGNPLTASDVVFVNGGAKSGHAAAQNQARWQWPA